MSQFDEPKDNFGDLFTIEEWNHWVEQGGFVPSDGCGYWGTETHYSYSFNCFHQAPAGATHVHWYNR